VYNHGELKSCVQNIATNFQVAFETIAFGSVNFLILKCYKIIFKKSKSFKNKILPGKFHNKKNKTVYIGIFMPSGSEHNNRAFMTRWQMLPLTCTIIYLSVDLSVDYLPVYFKCPLNLDIFQYLQCVWFAIEALQGNGGLPNLVSILFVTVCVWLGVAEKISQKMCKNIYRLEDYRLCQRVMYDRLQSHHHYIWCLLYMGTPLVGCKLHTSCTCSWKSQKSGIAIFSRQISHRVLCCVITQRTYMPVSRRLWSISELCIDPSQSFTQGKVDIRKWH
jgi:hypothetical protein